MPTTPTMVPTTPTAAPFATPTLFLTQEEGCSRSSRGISGIDERATARSLRLRCEVISEVRGLCLRMSSRIEVLPWDLGEFKLVGSGVQEAQQAYAECNTLCYTHLLV